MDAILLLPCDYWCKLLSLTLYDLMIVKFWVLYKLFNDYNFLIVNVNSSLIVKVSLEIKNQSFKIDQRMIFVDQFPAVACNYN